MCVCADVQLGAQMAHFFESGGTHELRGLNPAEAPHGHRLVSSRVPLEEPRSSTHFKAVTDALFLHQEHPECALNPIYAEAGENGPAVNV